MGRHAHFQACKWNSPRQLIFAIRGIRQAHGKQYVGHHPIYLSGSFVVRKT